MISIYEVHARISLSVPCSLYNDRGRPRPEYSIVSVRLRSSLGIRLPSAYLAAYYLPLGLYMDKWLWFARGERSISQLCSVHLYSELAEDASQKLKVISYSRMGGRKRSISWRNLNGGRQRFRVRTTTRRRLGHSFCHIYLIYHGFKSKWTTY
jgi:hypothetical protein